MLFLDIYEVKADTSVHSFRLDCTFYPNVSKDHTYGTISGGGGSFYQGTGSIISNTGSTTTYSNLGYSYHVRAPFVFNALWSEIGGTGQASTDAYSYFALLPRFTYTNSSGHIDNLTLYYGDKIVYTSNMNSGEAVWLILKGYDIRYGGTSDSRTNFSIPFVLEYDISFATSEGATENLPAFTSSIYFDMQINGRLANNLEIENGKVDVSDSGTQQKLSDLNQSTDKIEESVTSETGGGILATLKNFFGSFFENVINSFKSLFIPEDGYFTDWFNRLNTLLADKLGMLYAPFDLLITTLQAIYNADSSETGIPFPGIKWNDTWLVEATTFNFDSLGDSEGIIKLRDTVYFASDTVLLFAFLYLLQSKVRHILED